MYMIINIYRHGYCVKCHFQHYFSYIVAVSFSDGENRGTIKFVFFASLLSTQHYGERTKTNWLGI